MKSLTVVIGALTVFALGACKVETSGSTSTGAGGGSTTASATTGGVGGAGGSGATGTGGAPACVADYTCAEAITPPDGDSDKLCAGAHLDLFNALAACTCEGACKAACGDNACTGANATADCTTCLQAAAPDGCKKEFDDCSNDL